MNPLEIVDRLSHQLLAGGRPLAPNPDARPAPPGKGPVAEIVKRAEASCDGAFVHVEFGTWMGDSAIEAASASDRVVVLCVDTWLGSSEHWLTPGGPWGRGQLALVDGLPTFFDRFLSNMRRHAQSDRIIPLRMTTACAADILRHPAYAWLPIRSILVDAAHDRASVVHDLAASRDILARREGGWLLGHDWPWPPVRQAYADVFGTGTPETLRDYFARPIPKA